MVKQEQLARLACPLGKTFLRIEGETLICGQGGPGVFYQGRYDLGPLDTAIPTRCVSEFEPRWACRCRVGLVSAALTLPSTLFVA